MKFGVNKSVPSPRTYLYEYTVKRPIGKIQIPDEFIISELPKVKNQGSVNSCCACAAAEVLEILNLREFGEHAIFSEGYIYGRCRSPQGKYKGMYPDLLVEKLRKKGSVPTTIYNKCYEMPEMQELLNNNPHISKLDELAEKYRLKAYVAFLGKKYAEMKEALYMHDTPLFAVCEDYFRESHAIIIVGYTESGFIIQNSWGEKWGNKGRKEIPFDAVDYAYLFIDEVFNLNFKDVKETDWFYKAVKEMVFGGIMKGRSEDTFDPIVPPTRAELAQFGVNILKKIEEIQKIKEG